MIRARVDFSAASRLASLACRIAYRVGALRALQGPAWPQFAAVAAMLLLAACGDGSDGSTETMMEPEFLPGEVAVIPRPLAVWVDAAGTQFTLDPSTRLLVEAGRPELDDAAAVLRDLLASHFSSAIAIRAHRGTSAPRGSVLLTTTDAAADIGEEGYELVATEANLIIRVQSRRGALHAVQTLRQLLPVEIESPSSSGSVAVPSVRIVDHPRFPWRGFMLDVSRTFFPIQFLHRWLELMALHKLSVFHLHLTDDQGWRMEIDAFPQLHQLASSFDPARFPNERGGYYTKDELRELVAHASRLGIEIVPEIDMPGHSLALLHALPDLACRQDLDVPREREEFSIHPWTARPLIHKEIVCACDEQVYDVLATILEEVIEIFPSRWVHLGGDEVRKVEWAGSPLCGDFMLTNELNDFEHVQAWFTKRMEELLAARGRTLVGWDETLAATAHGDERTQLAADTVVMHWRDFIPAAADLYDRPVVQTPFSALYLDYYGVPVELTYAYDPVPADLTPAQQANVIGVQGNMWTGFEPQRSEGRIDLYAFPRLAAVAEVAWSAAGRRDFADFLKRYEVLVPRLARLGVQQGECADCVP